MKRHLAITAVMLLCSAVFFVVVCAGADLKANSNSSAVVTRPFNGTWVGASTFYFPRNCCPADKPLLAIATAKGIATLAGKCEWDSTYCCNPTSGECVGTAKITAANGDEIHLSLIHNFDPVSGDWNQTEEIIGGTGRFEGATGSGSSSGTSTPTGQFSDIWEGKNVDMISY